MGNKKIFDNNKEKMKKPIYVNKTVDILIQKTQLKFCVTFGIINLYKIVKYMIVLNKVYPFSDSNITKHKEIKKIAIESSLFIDFVKITNSTTKRGGRSKYILLRLI